MDVPSKYGGGGHIYNKTVTIQNMSEAGKPALEKVLRLNGLYFFYEKNGYDLKSRDLKKKSFFKKKVYTRENRDVLLKWIDCVS